MLVQPSDLALYMDHRFDNRMTDIAEMVLAGVQGEIEAFLRRPIELDQFDEEYVIPEDHLLISASAYFYDRTLSSESDYLSHIVQPPYQIHLRNTPVISVVSVQVKPRTATTWTTLTEGTHYISTRWGIDLWNAFQYDLVNVVYNAGLDGANIPYLKLMVMRVAAREMQTRVDDVVGIKELQTNEAIPTAIGLSDDEKKTLRRWKRKQI